MSEFQHYATRDEAIETLRDATAAHGLRLVPHEPTLAEPRIETYPEVTDEVIEKLARFPIVELEGGFTKFPVAFGRRDSGSAAGTYYVDSNIGPRLEYFVPGVNQTPRPTLTPGSLSYRKQYRNLETLDIVPASVELKDAYKRVVATIKKRLVPVKMGGETVWVGREAKQQLDGGTLFLDR
jgi:hypothetical protein